MFNEPVHTELTQLSKTEFIQYLYCQNSFWLLKRDSEKYPEGEFSVFLSKPIKDGYLVEKYAKLLFENGNNGSKISFQQKFQTDSRLFTRADIYEVGKNGQTHLYEVKSSAHVKTDRTHNHLKDACFQLITAERSGQSIDRVSIIHLNGDYVRDGDIIPSELLIIRDVTAEVRAIQQETEAEIDAALALLDLQDIDRSSCSCLQQGRANHCDSFSYFNPQIPTPSIYSLPRLSEKKRLELLEDSFIDLDHVPDNFSLSPQQSAVLAAAKSKKPVIKIATIRTFFEKLTYPLYFFDFETYASAVPLIDGMSPHKLVPFQYSLHILSEDGGLQHREYLAQNAQLPAELINQMERDFGNSGSVVSWHASFEKTQNKEMARMYPEHADFLTDINDRIVDLEDLFKTAYVDIRFNGYTSIKKVLPVICPELSYQGLEVQDGTAAMDAWARMVDPSVAADEKKRIETALLKYCKLDTLAMVEIYRFLEKLLRV